MPKRSRAIPAQETRGADSLTSTVPNSDAVSGSASDSVTAVEAGTFANPVVNNRYAAPVAMTPI